MPGLHELLSPLAALTSASGRDRDLIATLELAALSGQPVVLPPRIGRVSARVKQAARQASERAECYQRWQERRSVNLDPETLATELEWPYWEEIPALGEVFEDAGQHYWCLEVLRHSAADGSQGHSLILALALPVDGFGPE